MYYIVPIETVAEFQRSQDKEFKIEFVKIKTGEYVINTNCGEEIFKQLNWNEFEKRDLKKEDFIENKLNLDELYKDIN